MLHGNSQILSNVRYLLQNELSLICGCVNDVSVLFSYELGESVGRAMRASLGGGGGGGG